MRHFIANYMIKIANWLDGSGWYYDEFDHGFRDGANVARQATAPSAFNIQRPVSIEITEDDDGDVSIALYDANGFSCGGADILAGKKIVATLLFGSNVISSDTYTIGKFIQGNVN
jgi:hypothetical protein